MGSLGSTEELLKAHIPLTMQKGGVCPEIVKLNWRCKVELLDKIVSASREELDMIREEVRKSSEEGRVWRQVKINIWDGVQLPPPEGIL